MILSQFHQSNIYSMFSQISYIFTLIYLVNVVQTSKIQGSLETQPQLGKLIKSILLHL